MNQKNFKKIIPGLFLTSCLFFALYTFYLWFFLEESQVDFEVKLLSAASVLSFLGLSTLYYFQSRLYLNNFFINFIALILSVLFLVGSSFLLYISYESYKKKLIELGGVAKLMTDEKHLTSKDAKIYLQLIEHKNRLIGYQYFLKDTVINFDPRKYNNNIEIKEVLKKRLFSKAGTQEYWDDILNAVFHVDPIKGTYKRHGYELMYVYSNERHASNESNNDKALDLLLNESTNEYWQALIRDADRSPEHITTFWKDNKAFIYTFFSKSRYDILCKQVVDDLIAIKEKINEQENYKSFYDNYDISDPIFLMFPDSAFVKKYTYTWPFSFWDRRHEEKNDTVIYEILKEIQLHYRN